jgi:hypothetical protein
MSGRKFSVRNLFKKSNATRGAVLHHEGESSSSSSTVNSSLAKAQPLHPQSQPADYCRTITNIGTGSICEYEQIEDCRAKGCWFCDLIWNGLTATTKGQPANIVLGIDDYGSVLRGRIQPRNSASINVEFHRYLDCKTPNG